MDERKLLDRLFSHRPEIFSDVDNSLFRVKEVTLLEDEYNVYSLFFYVIFFPDKGITSNALYVKKDKQNPELSKICLGAAVPVPFSLVPLAAINALNKNPVTFLDEIYSKFVQNEETHLKQAKDKLMGEYSKAITGKDEVVSWWI